MTLADRITTAQEQLRTLADTAAHAHSLAYDRPGITHNAGRPTRDPHKLPTRTVHGTPTAAADDAWARRYLQAAIDLAHADMQISRAAQLTTRTPWPPLQTSHIRAPRPVVPPPYFVARICAHMQAGLAAIAHHDHPARKVDKLLTGTKPRGALLRINDAARAIPDTRKPPKPKTCRNPCHRDLCRGLPLKHKARRLCDSCLDHVHNVHRGDHGERCTSAQAKRAS